MIKFKTPLTYSNYFFGNFYRVLTYVPLKIYVVILLTICLYLDLVKDYNLSLFCIIIFFYVFPLINFLIVRLHHKVKKIEYFFSNSTFGYTVRDSKVEIKKKAIKNIKIKTDCILIKTAKTTLYFIIERNDLKKIKKSLFNSSYKKLILS